LLDDEVEPVEGLDLEPAQVLLELMARFLHAGNGTDDRTEFSHGVHKA
jgi:hypothetical protein